MSARIPWHILGFVETLCAHSKKLMIHHRLLVLLCATSKGLLQMYRRCSPIKGCEDKVNITLSKGFVPQGNA
jgi:hypothetical protein